MFYLHFEGMSIYTLTLQDEDPAMYSLLELIIEHDIREREMDLDECPWPQLLKARRVRTFLCKVPVKIESV